MTRQVGAELGEPDAVLVFDPSANALKGTESVSVARQWCGRLGKVENCQVGVYLGYATKKEHALRPGYHGPRWTERQLRLLGTDADEAVAALVGRTPAAVRVATTSWWRRWPAAAWASSSRHGS